MTVSAIEHYDDERGSDGGIVVTLKYGWSFERTHEGVRGFDTTKEAREATKIINLHRCHCDLCTQHLDTAVDRNVFAPEHIQMKR